MKEIFGGKEKLEDLRKQRDIIWREFEREISLGDFDLPVKLEPRVVYTALSAIFKDHTPHMDDSGLHVFVGKPTQVEKMKRRISTVLEGFISTIGGGSVGVGWATIIKLAAPTFVASFGPTVFVNTMFFGFALMAYLYSQQKSMKDFYEFVTLSISKITIDPEVEKSIVQALNTHNGTNLVSQTNNFNGILKTFAKLYTLDDKIENIINKRK